MIRMIHVIPADSSSNVGGPFGGRERGCGCGRARNSTRTRARARARAREGINFNGGEYTTVGVEGEAVLGMGVQAVYVDAVESGTCHSAIALGRGQGGGEGRGG